VVRGGRVVEEEARATRAKQGGSRAETARTSRISIFTSFSSISSLSCLWLCADICSVARAVVVRGGRVVEEEARATRAKQGGSRAEKAARSSPSSPPSSRARPRRPLPSENIPFASVANLPILEVFLPRERRGGKK
jgi:hypothetical protein